MATTPKNSTSNTSTWREEFLSLPRAFQKLPTMADQYGSEATVLLNLLVFSTINVHVCFSHLNAIFQAKRIHSQRASFAYVVEKLPPKVVSAVSDLLDNVLTDKPFDTLREAIIYRRGESEERRINDLFKTLPLGDSKPTQLLRKMKNLLGKNIMSDSLTICSPTPPKS